MRRGLLIAAISAVVVAVALVYWWHATTSAQSELSDLLLYAPADAKAVVYVDVAALRASSFAADLTALGTAEHPDREYLDFVKDTGFDYSRDLDRVMLVVRNSSPAQVELAVAEGRFDRARVEAYAARAGKVERAGTGEIYEFSKGAPAQIVDITFLDANRIALAQGAGARASLRSLFQRGRQPALEPEMHARLLRVAGSPVFATGQLEPWPENLTVGGLRSDQLTNLARSVRWVTLGIRPEGDLLKVAADGEFTTAENARQLAGTVDALQMFVQSAMNDAQTRAKLGPQTTALLDAMLRDLRVSQDGLRVRLTLELTHDQLRDILRGQPAAPAAGNR